jgi:hypothetical protein
LAKALTKFIFDKTLAKLQFGKTLVKPIFWLNIGQTHIWQILAKLKFS